MTKYKMKNGLTVYKMTAEEVIKTFPGGLGRCDFCNIQTKEGYYIPVLNRYYCNSCFNAWKLRSRNYPEDAWFEKEMIEALEFRMCLIGMRFDIGGTLGC